MNNMKGSSGLIVLSIIGLLLVLLVGGYLFLKPIKSSELSAVRENRPQQKKDVTKDSVSVSANPTPNSKITTVTLQDNYTFTFVMPTGYHLGPELGDYAAYVVDDKTGMNLIGFERGNGGGEGSKVVGNTMIDSVPFRIEDAMEIGCDVVLRPSQQKSPPGEIEIGIQMLFGIVTWCSEGNKPVDVIHKTIESIRFNDDLRAVLTGKSTIPFLPKGSGTNY